MTGAGPSGAANTKISETTNDLGGLWLTKLQRHLEASGLTLQQAADLVGYERTAFSRFFRKATGVGFKTWADRHRIERTLPRLRQNKDSITNIAFEFGFEDLTTFERTFYRVKGLTPREYRGRLRDAPL